MADCINVNDMDLSAAKLAVQELRRVCTGLEAENESLRAELDNRDAAIEAAVVEPLKAENERLRDALHGIRTRNPARPGAGLKGN